jgi:uncharacterized protein with GYD domain
MPTYITLANWTEQGVRTAKDTVARYRAAQQPALAAGVTIRGAYWTLGQYDIVLIVEAPDEQTAAQFTLATAMQGNIRTTMLRAFDEHEMEHLLERLPAGP